jgi:hypothetical protein
MWRPPYPSENLKTPRSQSQQPPVKTFSTTNPYAEPEPEHQSPRAQQAPAQCNQFQDFQDFQHSKRENNSDKIYERGLTPQMGMNPFLKDNDYLQDLDTQNQFLKPINTNVYSSTKTN